MLNAFSAAQIVSHAHRCRLTLAQVLHHCADAQVAQHRVCPGISKQQAESFSAFLRQNHPWTSVAGGATAQPTSPAVVRAEEATDIDQQPQALPASRLGVPVPTNVQGTNPQPSLGGQDDGWLSAHQAVPVASDGVQQHHAVSGGPGRGAQQPVAPADGVHAPSAKAIPLPGQGGTLAAKPLPPLASLMQPPSKRAAPLPGHDRVNLPSENEMRAPASKVRALGNAGAPIWAPVHRNPVQTGQTRPHLLSKRASAEMWQPVQRMPEQQLQHHQAYVGQARRPGATGATIPQRLLSEQMQPDHAYPAQPAREDHWGTAHQTAAAFDPYDADVTAVGHDIEDADITAMANGIDDLMGELAGVEDPDWSADGGVREQPWAAEEELFSPGCSHDLKLVLGRSGGSRLPSAQSPSTFKPYRGPVPPSSHLATLQGWSRINSAVTPALRNGTRASRQQVCLCNAPSLARTRVDYLIGYEHLGINTQFSTNVGLAAR